MTSPGARGVLQAVAAALIEDDAVLLGLRAATDSYPLMWELPGGKVEPGETHVAALARELDEELGIAVEVGAHLATGRAPMKDGRDLVLEVYRVHRRSGRLALREHAACAWFRREHLAALDPALVPPADRAPLERILGLLAGAASTATRSAGR